jgi:hypothetical protein
MSLKEDIVEIFCAIYKVPGEFLIASIICYGFWEATKSLAPIFWWFWFFSIFFFILEVIFPILAGVRIYGEAITWIKDRFK